MKIEMEVKTVVRTFYEEVDKRLKAGKAK